MNSLLAVLLMSGASLVLARDDENAWAREDEREAQKDARLEERRKEHIEREFNEYDRDKNGVLDGADIRSKFGNILEAEMLFQFFADADKDQSGTITLPEYSAYIELVEARAAQKSARSEDQQEN